MKIGKKSNNLETGYVYAPYIILDIVSNPGFTSSKMTQRYKSAKIEKIKNILNKIEDLKTIS